MTDPGSIITKRLRSSILAAAVIMLTALIFYSPFIYTQSLNTSLLYKKAETEYRKFIKNRKIHSKTEEWEKCVNRYREIVILRKDSIYADDASYMVAYIYFRMYERFTSPAYLNSALNSFTFLLQNYPKSVYIEKSLYYSGFIHHKYMNDRDKARYYFNTLISEFPKGKYTKEAKKYMDLMARASTAPPPARKEGFSVLTNLKYWSSPDYTRIVAYLDSPAGLTNQRLYKPDRIYFDLSRTRISKNIAQWMMIVEDNLLKRVRIGHFNTKTTRIVLDLEKVGKYTVFTLTDPFRLVVDITSEKYARKKAMPQLVELRSKKTGLLSNSTKPDNGKHVSSSNNQKPKDGTVKTPPVSKQEKTTTKARPIEQKTATVVPLKNSSGDYSIVRQLGLGVTTIVLDPGHGGKDPGVVISKGVYEKDLVLNVALKLKSILEKQKGYQVFLTRSGDTYVSLEERTAKAMQYKADLFISIHMNSYRKKNLAGMELYYLGFATDRQSKAIAAYENSMNQKSITELQGILRMMVNAKVDESHDMARLMKQSIPPVIKRKYPGFKLRAIKQAPFIVLIGANMPSVLVELGYLSNSGERKLLLRPSYRSQLAYGLARGIEAYIKNLNGKLVNRN